MKHGCAVSDSGNPAIQGVLLWSHCTGLDAAAKPATALLFDHRVTVLRGQSSRFGFTKLVDEYANLSRVPFNVTEVKSEWWDEDGRNDDLSQQALLSLEDYDAWALTPSALALLSDAGMLLPLGKVMEYDTSLASYWADIPKTFRNAAGVYASQIVGLPYTAEVPLMFWRRDILDQMGLQPPTTWDETLALGKLVNGSERPCLSDPVKPCVMRGVCLAFPDGCFYNGMLLTAIWASMVGARGTPDGLFFHPTDMKPRFTGEAMREASRIYRELLSLGPEESFILPNNCPRGKLDEGVDKCFIGIGVSSVVKAVGFSLARGKLGMSLLPGSPVVQDRGSEVLTKCTERICPYATAVQSGNGTVLISRVPYLGRGAMSLAFSSRASPNRALAAFSAVDFALTYKGGWPYALDPNVLTMSVRKTHLSRDNLGMWVDSEYHYDRQDMTEFLAVVEASLGHPCLALGPRSAGGARFEAAWINAAWLALNEPEDPYAPAKFLNDTFYAILGTHYGSDMETFRKAYWRGVGFNPPPDPGSGPGHGGGGGGGPGSDGDGPVGPGDGDDSGSNSPRLNTGALVGTVVGGACAFLLLCLVVAVFGYQRARLDRSSHTRRPVAPPGYSPDTSLCITDIQSSTTLWEELDASVMDLSLSLHNACVRGLLPRHRGYECHTEGDSFVLAFHSAVGAVGFALEMQVALLHVAWPEPLLQHPACAAVQNSAAMLGGSSTAGGSNGGVGTTGGGAATGGAATSRHTMLGMHGGHGGHHSTTYLHPLVLLAQLHMHNPFAGSSSTFWQLQLQQQSMDRDLRRNTSQQQTGLEREPSNVSSVTGGVAGPGGFCGRWGGAVGPAAGTLPAAYGSNSDRGALMLAASSRSLSRKRLYGAYCTAGMPPPYVAGVPEARPPSPLPAFLTGPRRISPASHSPVQLPTSLRSESVSSLRPVPSAGTVSGAPPLLPPTVSAPTPTPVQPPLLQMHLRPAGLSGSVQGSMSPKHRTAPGGMVAVDRTGLSRVFQQQLLEAEESEGRAPEYETTRGPVLTVPAMDPGAPAAGAAAEVATSTAVEPTAGSSAALDTGALATASVTGTVAFRGFRVRVGICSGLEPGRDVVYQKDLSRRMAYSGVCMKMTKLISDAAVGGMVLLGPSTLDRLMPLPRKDLPGLVVWHKGRFMLVDKDADITRHPAASPALLHSPPPSYRLPPPPPSWRGAASFPCSSDSAQMDMYQATSSSMMPRQVLLERLPLRTRGQVLPGVLSAPLGCVVLAMVQVVGVSLLKEWNEVVTQEAVGLLHSAALEQLRLAGGYPALMEDGQILAAFTSAPAAVRWLLTLEEELRCYVPWPAELLEHELGEELTVHMPATGAGLGLGLGLPSAQGSHRGGGWAQFDELTAAGSGSGAGFKGPSRKALMPSLTQPGIRGSRDGASVHVGVVTNPGYGHCSSMLHRLPAGLELGGPGLAGPASSGVGCTEGSGLGGGAVGAGGAGAGAGAGGSGWLWWLNSQVRRKVSGSLGADAGAAVTGAAATAAAAAAASAAAAVAAATAAGVTMSSPANVVAGQPQVGVHRLGLPRQKAAPCFVKRSLSDTGSFPLTKVVTRPQPATFLGAEAELQESSTPPYDSPSSVRSNLTSPGRQTPNSYVQHQLHMQSQEHMQGQGQAQGQLSAWQEPPSPVRAPDGERLEPGDVPRVQSSQLSVPVGRVPSSRPLPPPSAVHAPSAAGTPSALWASTGTPTSAALVHSAEDRGSTASHGCLDGGTNNAAAATNVDSSGDRLRDPGDMFEAAAAAVAAAPLPTSPYRCPSFLDQQLQHHHHHHHHHHHQQQQQQLHPRRQLFRQRSGTHGGSVSAPLDRRTWGTRRRHPAAALGGPRGATLRLFRLRGGAEPASGFAPNSAAEPASAGVAGVTSGAIVTAALGADQSSPSSSRSISKVRDSFGGSAVVTRGSSNQRVSGVREHTPPPVVGRCLDALETAPLRRADLDDVLPLQPSAPLPVPVPVPVAAPVQVRTPAPALASSQPAGYVLPLGSQREDFLASSPPAEQARSRHLSQTQQNAPQGFGLQHQQQQQSRGSSSGPLLQLHMPTPPPLQQQQQIQQQQIQQHQVQQRQRNPSPFKLHPNPHPHQHQHHLQQQLHQEMLRQRQVAAMQVAAMQVAAMQVAPPEETCLSMGLAAHSGTHTTANNNAACQQSGQLPRIVTGQHRVLRGLRVRCAVEEGSFFQDGSVCAARLYRHQHGGKPFARLAKLCAGALMGQVVCSGAVAKKIQRAAAGGDTAAQQLRVVARNGSSSMAAGAAAVAAAAGPGSLGAMPSRPAGALSRHGLSAVSGFGAPDAGNSDMEALAAAATAYSPAPWEAADLEESISDGRPTRPAFNSELVPGKAQLFVCSWSREVMHERLKTQRAYQAIAQRNAAEDTSLWNGDVRLGTLS